MSIFAICFDSIGLIVGSLLLTGLLSFAAWWLADHIHRSWIPWWLLLALYTGMLISPLEGSLFVRITAVFGFFITALLSFIWRHEKGAAEAESESSRELLPQTHQQIREHRS